MKDLKERIFDNFHFEPIGINEGAQEPKSLWAGKLEAKQIQDKLKSFFVGQKTKVSLTNKNELGKFFKAFVETLTFGNRMKNLQVLKDYGMATEQGFASVILGNQKEFEEKKWDTSCIKNFDPTELEKKFNAWKESDDFIQGNKVEDANDQGDLDDRILIVYDRWNPDVAEEFDLIGKRGKQTEHHVNMCRVEFGKDNDVKYYDCYPILAKNYFGHLDEIKKRAELGIMDIAAYQQV